MSNNLNSKIAELMSSLDDKVLKAKLDKLISNIKAGKTEELAKKLQKIDKTELMEKLEGFDVEKLKKLNINESELEKVMSSNEFENFAKSLGDGNSELLAKLKDKLSKSS